MMYEVVWPAFQFKVLKSIIECVCLYKFWYAHLLYEVEKILKDRNAG